LEARDRNGQAERTSADPVLENQPRRESEIELSKQGLVLSELTL
jgi:hypothetical protein